MNWRSLHELYNATRQDSSEIDALPPPLHTQNSTLILLGCPAQELRETYAMDTKTDGWGPTLNTSDERRQCGNRVRESGSDEGGIDGSTGKPAQGKNRAATASSWQQCPYLDRSTHEANATSHACDYIIPHLHKYISLQLPDVALCY